MKRQAFASYPWYIADWRNSKARLLLNLEERAAYRELLDFCYDERTLPTDERALARIVNCSDEEFQRVWLNVQKLFNETNGRYRHPKVDQVLAKLDGYREQKRAAGRASGERRRNGKGNGKGTERVTGGVTESEPSSSSSIHDDKEALRTVEEIRAKPLGFKNGTTNDDKRTPVQAYASPQDELIALMEQSTGLRPDTKLFRQICEAVEINGGTMSEFLADIRPRIPRLKRAPGPGFFKSHAQKWGHPETQPVPEPETAESKEYRTGKCPKCQGVGMLDGAYCVCRMGAELRKVDARKKPSQEATT